jgi:uncharacterized membrane protein YoaK (UPF0700 family)
MFHHKASDASNRAIFQWFLASFSSGAVNAGGYLACARFVSHVTGFATLFGVDLAAGKFEAAFGILSVPAFFLIGVMISAYLVDRRVSLGLEPRFSTAMLLVAICLTFVALGGSASWFSGFGEEIRLKRDYLMLALLCMASGLQNAAITSATGATVRTTHLTGVTTDLGIGLVRVFTHSRIDETSIREKKANWHRAGTIASFGLGSALSAFVFNELHYLGFLLPALIALYLMTVARIESRTK